MREGIPRSKEEEVIHGEARTLLKGLRPMENPCSRIYTMKGLWPVHKPMPEKRKHVRMKEKL